MRWVLAISILLSAGAVLTNIIAVCLPYWLYTDMPVKSYQGLWQVCEPNQISRSDNTIDCNLIKLGPEFLDATRVMMLFGLSLYTFALIFALVYTFCRNEKPGYITAATYCMLFGAILCMIGVVAYGALYPRLKRAKGKSLHAGFALGVLSTVLGFVNMLFYCLAKARGDVETY